MKFIISTTASLLAAIIIVVVTPPTPVKAATTTSSLPSRVVDSHHHFLDFANNGFSSWLGGMFGNLTYLPEDYNRDVVEPLAEEGVDLIGSVHLEILPDTPLGGVEETKWIQSMVDAGRSKVKAIVGSCDLGDTDNVDLEQMNGASPLLRGIRWILDYVGPYDDNGNSATHLNAIRKDLDYLRGGGSDDSSEDKVVPSFETGYATLAKYGWSFDAQLAPEQLPALAELASKYPNIPLIINHLSKPRHVLGRYSNNSNIDQQATEEWRTGMKLIANAHDNTYVKLSMLGYAVPDWILDDEKRVDVVKSLVLETVNIFGPKRSMFGLNWFLGSSISDNDGLGTVGPSPVQLVNYVSEWLISANYSNDDREWIFAKTAETVYKMNISSTSTSDGGTTTEVNGGGGTDDEDEPTGGSSSSSAAGFTLDSKMIGGSSILLLVTTVIVGVLVVLTI